MDLIPFIPKTANYQIWYPEDFIVDEDEKGIVSITSPESFSNLTLSCYSIKRSVTEAILQDFFREATENYTASSEMKSVTTENKIWLEGDFQRENIFWVWWVLSHSNQIILASVNSEKIIDSADRHLFRFMIDKMEIYPVDIKE
jgi:hypothetical protein